MDPRRDEVVGAGRGAYFPVAADADKAAAIRRLGYGALIDDFVDTTGACERLQIVIHLIDVARHPHSDRRSDHNIPVVPGVSARRRRICTAE